LQKEEDEEENRMRLLEQAVSKANLRESETKEERMARVLIDRECHQLYRNNETEEEANERRETHRELHNYRETKNEDETEERREESRLRIETIRQEREEEEEMIRATLLTSRSLFPRKLKKKEHSENRRWQPEIVLDCPELIDWHASRFFLNTWFHSMTVDQ
jgi:hypothetical protein